MAPEVIKAINRGKAEPYGYEVDIWAIGVFLYNFLEGKPPFNSREPLENLRKIVAKNIRFSPDLHRSMQGLLPISAEAKQLVMGILEPDKEKRLTL